MLAAEADRLAGLGDVQLIVIDVFADVILAPTRDAESIRRAVGSLPSRGAYGGVVARRAAVSAADDRLDRITAAADELALIRWQREALVDRLVDSDIDGPKALFFLQNAFDMQIQQAYSLNTALSTGTPSPALDNSLLAPTLAAAGWVVYPLAPGGAPEGLRTADGQADLARQSGGRVIDDAADLDLALSALEGAVSVALDIGEAATGPLRLEFAPLPESVTPPSWVEGTFLPGRSAARARKYLNEDLDGGIEVTTALHYADASEQNVIVEVRAQLPPGAAAPSSDWLALALYLDQIEAPPLTLELQGRSRLLDGIDLWVGQVALQLPADPGELVAVVSNGANGQWGAARVEDDGGHLIRPGPGLLVEQFDLRPPPEVETEADTPTLITLLAPRGTALKGRQRFRTLVTAPVISSVVFSLDDEVVATDDDAPFAARIDLGASVGRHTVRVEAFDTMGNLIGSDMMRLNEPARSFDVSIAVLALEPSLKLDATVGHPTDVPIERLEFYYNENLLDTRHAEPWTIESRIGDIGQTDYVRVVAYFGNGTFLEDVQLLSTLGGAEEVEVNLVQVYVVATDKQGEPVTDLTADDFEIRLRGAPQRIDRFAYADEVPLKLALVIDSSGSMMVLMQDTKRAAARFLTQVLTDKDEAVVIDFDDRPRVAAALTDDIGELLLSLGSMVAEERAMTALYDSVIFGSLELPSGQDRKAIVLLTDGDDTKSRFSLGRAIDAAKEAGVPVYVVSLVGIQDPRRGGQRPDITALTRQTGGEAYYLRTMSELVPTYDHIARELRSQYLLAFPTDSQLSERDIESIKVSALRPGIEIRTVVGGRSIN